MRKIIIEKSPYSLFLFFLMENYEKDTVFILNKGIPYSIVKNIKKEYENVYFVEQLNLRRDRSLINIKKDINILKNYFFYVFKLRKNKKIKIYGKPDLYLSWFFILKEFYLLEEGKEIPNYFNSHLLNIYFGRYLQRIYLTENSEIDKKFLSRVDRIEILKLWKDKNEKEKSKILNYFNLNEDILKKLEGKKFLLLTQPIEEHGISEEEKIKIYKEILSNLENKIEDELIIKMHPREKTNYYKWFPKATIIQGDIINEIFYILNIKFENVITLFSTAACNIEYEKLYFFGTAGFEKLEKEFGIIKCYIEKSNKNKL